MNKEERDFDEEMKMKLKEEYQIDEIRKERLWNRIDSELEFKSKRKKKQYWKPVIASAAACLLLAIGFTTEQGSNIVNNIRDSFVSQKDAQNFNGSSGDNQGTETEGNTPDNKAGEDNVDATHNFPPTKEVVIELEGQKQKPFSAVLHESPASDYVIYVDENNYKAAEDNGNILITPKEPMSEEYSHYPELFMKISHDERSVDQAIADLEKELKVTFEETDWPRPSYTAHYEEGPKWNDDAIHKYYVISDDQGGSYFVHQQLFGEAQEGTGVRFDYMLKDLHTIK